MKSSKSYFLKQLSRGDFLKFRGNSFLRHPTISLKKCYFRKTESKIFSKFKTLRQNSNILCRLLFYKKSVSVWVFFVVHRSLSNFLYGLGVYAFQKIKAAFFCFFSFFRKKKSKNVHYQPKIVLANTIKTKIWNHKQFQNINNTRESERQTYIPYKIIRILFKKFSVNFLIFKRVH